MNKRASSEPQTLRGKKKTVVVGAKKTQKSKKAAAKKPRVRKPIDRLKFIEARANGMSPTEAAFEASGATNAHSAATIGGKLSKDVTIQQAVAEALARKGITIDNAIQPIADGLTAEKTVIIGGGDDAFTNQVPDHAIRLKASGMALDLMGARNRGDGGSNIHFHLHANQQQGQYGI